MKKYGNPKLDRPYESKEHLKFHATLRDDRAELKRLLEEERKERSEKLRLLCLHYNIRTRENKFVFIELTLALAKEFVRGFQEKKRKGAKNKWDYVTDLQLKEDMEKLIDPDNPSKGISYAAKILANREPWIRFLGINTKGDKRAESLRKAYHRCKRQDEISRVKMRKFIKEQFPELVKNLR